MNKGFKTTFPDPARSVIARMQQPVYFEKKGYYKIDFRKEVMKFEEAGFPTV